MSFIEFKVPGKVVINGSYIVLRNEYAVSLAINKYLSIKAESKKSLNSGVFILEFMNEQKTVFDLGTEISNPKTAYFQQVIIAFFKLSRINNTRDITIRANFDDGFYIGESSKTGIGSSGCIFVAVVYLLIRFYENEFVESCKKLQLPTLPDPDEGIQKRLKDFGLMEDTQKFVIPFFYRLNKIMNPKSSSIDVFTSLFGTIKYNMNSIIAYYHPHKDILLGSYGRSTNTNEALGRVDINDSSWQKVIKSNSKINENQSKANFKKYLCELKDLGSFIVPYKQFRILMKTFDWDIYGCGISGSGGEDAVWCIFGEDQIVTDLWSNEFPYLIKAEILETGLTAIKFYK